MTFSIMRRFLLQSAHRLPRVPPSHKCSRLHGHTWVVEVWVEGAVGVDGWVQDFADIDAAWMSLVHPEFDHRDLTEVVENPTTENLCVEIARRLVPALPNLRRIVARENDRSAVELRLG